MAERRLALLATCLALSALIHAVTLELPGWSVPDLTERDAEPLQATLVAPPRPALSAPSVPKPLARPRPAPPKPKPPAAKPAAPTASLPAPVEEPAPVQPGPESTPAEGGAGTAGDGGPAHATAIGRADLAASGAHRLRRVSGRQGFPGRADRAQLGARWSTLSHADRGGDRRARRAHEELPLHPAQRGASDALGSGARTVPGGTGRQARGGRGLRLGCRWKNRGSRGATGQGPGAAGSHPRRRSGRAVHLASTRPDG